ncbi:hypothetical protein Pint_30314 [Pistacia integerrima]|uniref:Uncharacterized protein n=1 Tax=Pistacia integerrima TaxID=434235 RepID=A0ACC0X496_9ROSI|nr:hypothetical protein Pint_30314 [Pistacia integerrima]
MSFVAMLSCFVNWKLSHNFQKSVRRQRRRGQEVEECSVPKELDIRQQRRGSPHCSCGKFLYVCQKLVKYMAREQLASKNFDGDTSFVLAAASGRVEAVTARLKKNDELHSIRGDDKGMLPIHSAVQRGHEDIVEYQFTYTVSEISDIHIVLEVIQIKNS